MKVVEFTKPEPVNEDNKEMARKFREFADRAEQGEFSAYAFLALTTEDGSILRASSFQSRLQFLGAIQMMKNDVAEGD